MVLKLVLTTESVRGHLKTSQTPVCVFFCFVFVIQHMERSPVKADGWRVMVIAAEGKTFSVKGQQSDIMTVNTP